MQGTVCTCSGDPSGLGFAFTNFLYNSWRGDPEHLLLKIEMIESRVEQMIYRFDRDTVSMYQRKFPSNSSDVK